MLLAYGKLCIHVSSSEFSLTKFEQFLLVALGKLSTGVSKVLMSSFSASVIMPCFLLLVSNQLVFWKWFSSNS